MEGLGIEEEAGLPSSETQEKRMRKGSPVSISWERGGVGEVWILERSRGAAVLTH